MSTVSMAKLLVREHVVVPSFVLQKMVADEGKTRLCFQDFTALVSPPRSPRGPPEALNPAPGEGTLAPERPRA